MPLAMPAVPLIPFCIGDGDGGAWRVFGEGGGGPPMLEDSM